MPVQAGASRSGDLCHACAGRRNDDFLPVFQMFSDIVIEVIRSYPEKSCGQQADRLRERKIGGCQQTAHGIVTSGQQADHLRDTKSGWSAC